ncbi:MAG: hypothetical protein GTO18_16510 [Anaerolineales bacterium]|nr:hypothetical protein [Anaerolineales bacterium]
MTLNLNEERLKVYRAKTFCTMPGYQLLTVEESVPFVDERGFIFFWPVKGFDLPSLWVAVAGDRPVPNEHDDPGHTTWGWKDAMLDQRVWYYGKLLRGKATMVSLEVIPYFYVLTERMGDLDDYIIAYEEGKLSWEEKSIADVLLNYGALHTIELRRRAHLASASSKSRFDRAMTKLQSGLWVLPIGIARAGSWRYAFIYELFDRWFPEIFEQARDITRRQARKHLASLYIRSVGAAEPKAIGRLFGWGKELVDQVLGDLNEEGLAHEVSDGRWATRELIE